LEKNQKIKTVITNLLIFNYYFIINFYLGSFNLITEIDKQKAIDSQFIFMQFRQALFEQNHILIYELLSKLNQMVVTEGNSVYISIFLIVYRNSY